MQGEVKSKTKRHGEKNPVGRPRIHQNAITRNILISDEAVAVARRISTSSPKSISDGVRKALELCKKHKPDSQKDYSNEAYEAQFKNTRTRHIVLDDEAHKTAIRLGLGNMSAGVRIALDLLKAEYDNKSENEV